jgi:hypothetical protein
LFPPPDKGVILVSEHEPDRLDRLDVGLSLERLNLEIGKLPRLEIVEVGRLSLHEEPDSHRLHRLQDSIGDQGILRNPLVAARDHGRTSHILLDGVNRLEALRRLGARWVLVQEVDAMDRQVVLSTWHHAVEGMDGKDILTGLSPEAGFESRPGRFTDQGDFVPDFGEEVTCLVVLPDRSCYAVLSDQHPDTRLRVLQSIIRSTDGAANRDRVSYTRIRDLRDHYPAFSALLCYRGFSKHQVFDLSLDGRRVPSGITRFSVPKRALGFSVSLDFLRSRDTLKEKRRQLHRMLVERIRNKSIRFYEEPTFHFDE